MLPDRVSNPGTCMNTSGQVLERTLFANRVFLNLVQQYIQVLRLKVVVRVFLNAKLLTPSIYDICHNWSRTCICNVSFE